MRAMQKMPRAGQIVISGENSAVDKGIELALAAKARKAVKLPVSIAAHSELMRVVADEEMVRAVGDALTAAVEQVPETSVSPLSTAGQTT